MVKNVDRPNDDGQKLREKKQKRDKMLNEKKNQILEHKIKDVNWDKTSTSKNVNCK